MNKYLLLSLFLMVGCKTLTQEASLLTSFQAAPSVAKAESLLSQGELYQAKKMTRRVLEAEPTNREAQQLMGLILNEEIAMQKEAFFEISPTKEVRKQDEMEIEKWVDRSRSLLAMKQYDQALFAAEKIFTYDPKNIEASNLLDEINQKALEDGKHESLIQSSMMQDEVSARVLRYREQAQNKLSKQRYGETNLLVQKILMLSPEDPVGLELQSQLNLAKVEMI